MFWPLTNATIADNSAADGGGIYSATDGSYWSSVSTTSLLNTIVAGNEATSDPDIDTYSSSDTISGSYNLIGDGTGMTGLTNGTNGNLVGTSALPINVMLGSLANNGGPTQTLVPQTDSPAFGTGGPLAKVVDPISDASATTLVANNGCSFSASDLSSLSSGAYYTIQVDCEQMAVTSAARQSYYQVGDILTVEGGTYTTAAQLTVSSVTNGFVTGVSVTVRGSYSVWPSNPVSVTDTNGSGTGATFYLWNVADYVLYANPVSGGDVSVVLTVTRGVNSTTPTTHDSNTDVFLVSDQRDLLPDYVNPAIVNIGAC